MNETGRGACLCGAVKFKTYGKLRKVVGCHCTQCRKQTGHFWASTNILENELELDGEEALTWYASTPGYKRGFCSTCGSALFWKREDLEYISIGAGVFESPTHMVLASHIYCEDKGDYYEISDGLPQYAKGSPGVVTAG